MEDLKNTAITASIQAGLAILEVYNSDEFDLEFKKDNSPLTLADRKAHNIIMEHLIETGIPVLSEEGKDIPYEERKDWKLFWLVDPLDGTKEFVKKNGEFTVNIALIKNNKPVMGVIYVPVTDILYVGTVNEGAFIIEHVTKHKQETDLLNAAKRLPEKINKATFKVVASRSHINSETEQFIEKLKKDHDKIEIVSKGSSLKLCLIAEGKADIYPRFGPTSEWDTAAGHAIVLASGGKVVLAENESKELIYNKENILNPYFIAKRN
ncbi:MAG: 3'(2'),5'-bisphosphate nucleotidase CysQ [Chlorobi bacterium]|nr:3'(2'),5'-bisphosphate nucleotidase CysQ [Chlorobiota bacterium]